MNDESLIARIRALSQSLEPIPTGVQPRLRRIDGIRAILFDLYGTLLVSASGDVGTTAGNADNELLLGRIREFHAQRRAEGAEFPEVEIRAVWTSLGRGGDIPLLAVEHECSVNPVWPMPGAADVLDGLERRGFVTGLVSNAQFYSPLVFRALLGRPPPEPAVWSFQWGEAKPSLRLFRAALDALAGRGIAPHQVFYLGNDMVKDIRPAAALACRTGLFAGDARSYRPHDWRPPAAPPDLVITDLRQLMSVLPPMAA